MASSCLSRLRLFINRSKHISSPSVISTLSVSHTIATLPRSRFQSPTIRCSELVRLPWAARWMCSNGNAEACFPRSVHVVEGYSLLQKGHRYLDVRTVEEFSDGRPLGAMNIPYMFKSASEMSKNHNFVEEVASKFSKSDGIVIGCRSGKRSLMAASDLLSAGFTSITDLSGGYFEWLQNGLPSEK